MANEKEMESAPEKQGYAGYAFQAPRPLSNAEKKYLLSVERGDLSSVKRILQAASKSTDKNIDVNCVDSLGRGALTLAIESENLEMLELLVVMRVETKDALLHAINQEFVEAVELLLEHEELLRNLEIEASGGNCEDVVHSWQKVDPSLARYPPDMTPLILAAQKNNYEILKLLLDRGATLPMPHAIKCDCDDCVLQATTGDPLRLSSTRISEYRALASPSLIALSSPDPLMTAFKMSWDLRELSIAEPESRSEYLKLRQQVENFAVDLLQQTRSSSELNTILNYDPDDHSAKPTKRLARLEQAIQYKQKKFVAHPHVQQLLAAIWYEGVPGFRRMSTVKRFWILIKTALFFPFYCLIYFFLPNSKIGQTMRRPFMKFLVHASSYLFFLLVLIFVSQRFEEDLVGWFGSEYQKSQIEEASVQRGRGPSFFEFIVIIYVLGFIWEEAREVYVDGLRAYLRDLWNFIDFTRNLLYVTTGILRLAAYIQQQAEISNNDPAAKSLREDWSDFDPQLIAEGLFAAANVFSALKLVHLFSINPHLGPLQISLGRMVIDIVKFFFIYTLVLFAFACGLNQLLWYFAELERQTCYRDRYQDSWDPTSANCDRWRRFSSLFESCQSLFWASFGSVGIDSFELTGIKSYTRFWGLLMFGSYSVINIIVLLNLLIAMMSNSYSIIEEHSDTEWKFARTKLWMSYFEEGGTLPPPFNIFPHPKLCLRMCGLQRKSEGKRRSLRRIACEHRYYGSVMKALIWRYVVNAHSEHEMEPVTEDDIHELKNDFSSWRCELLDILKRNGMDTGGADTSERTVLGKKMRVWERRLMKDFQLSSLADDPVAEVNILQTVPDNEEISAKWRRIARLAVLKSAEHRWTQVIDGTVKKSQIGRSNNRTALKRQAKLKHVMEEAQRLSLKSPPPILSPIRLPDPVNPATILRVLKDDDDFDPSSRGISPARSVTPEPSSIVNHTKVIDPASVNYEDERFQNKSAPRPLMPLRSSPPRVVKRKSQAPAPGTAIPRPRSPCQKNRSNPNILSVENLQKNSSDPSIVRPRPRSPRIPEVTIIPVTPEARSKNCEGYSRFLKIEPKSPKVSPAKKSPRKGGGWL